MKRFIYGLTILNSIVFHHLFSQETNKRYFSFPKQATVDYSSQTVDYSPSLLTRQMPKPSSKKMVHYNYPQSKNTAQTLKPLQSTLSDVALGQNFFANPWGASTPNDNDMAISNNGVIVSVVNTNILVYSSETFSASPVKSLAAFTSPINSKHQEFDPKVIYDPNADRFILMCLSGFVDSTSQVIMGFSQTNDPNGNWNLYRLPGNPLNNNLWSDYPMMALTDKECFLTLNLLYNDSSWQTGFVESIVWQIKKDSGYAGLPLGSILHNNIKVNNKPLRNLCPVKGGSQLYGPNMYFLSNRNFASQNDSVFLVEIKDTIGSVNNTISIKTLVSNQSYYFPPLAIQPSPTQSLSCNDARNLAAFYENGKIQYVHNTKHPSNNRAAVYHGVINQVTSTNPTVNGYIISSDTMDFGYPNISYAGLSNADNTSIINFNHANSKIFPGCSAIKSDGLGNFSPILKIKDGLTHIDVISSNEERWGDYSGSQTQYNKPGVVWMSGYYAYRYTNIIRFAHGTWIAKLGVNPTVVLNTNNKIKEEEASKVFPNPAKNVFNIELELNEPEYLTFELYDVNGKLIDVLLRDWIKVKQNTFQFSLQDVSVGVYTLKITGNRNTLISKKIIKE